MSKQNDEHFKSTLALTFTNKASAEMKYRILLFLNDLKHQRDELVLEQILKTTSLDESAIQKRSSTILEKILYNYSNFTVRYMIIGDLTSGRSGCAGASSSTRGVIAGGYTGTHFTPSLTVVKHNRLYNHCINR